MLINKCKDADIKHGNDSKAFIEYSNDIDSNYKNIEEHCSNKEHKILIVFDNMIADTLSKKTKLFIRGRKLNIGLVFCYKILFCCTKKY